MGRFGPYLGHDWALVGEWLFLYTLLESIRPDDPDGFVMFEQNTTDDTGGTQATETSGRLDGRTRRGFLAATAAIGAAAGLGGTAAAQSGDSSASATFENQETGGKTVTVQSATLPEGGFVAIHDGRLQEGKVFESVIGVSDYLSAGTHEDVRVMLFQGVPGGDFDQQRLTEDQTLFAMPHLDTDGNQTYDFITSNGDADGPYTMDGQPVLDPATITVRGGNGGGNGDVPALEVLNYALTLEHLEATYYQQGLEEFSDSELMNAAVLCQRNEELIAQVPDRLRSIRDHEVAHVEQLSAVIEQLGGTPVERAEYEFPYETPSEFLQLAATFETTGVSAYDGAISLLSEDSLLTASATIATVEGRHSAFLNEITGKSPFPRAFDEAKSMEQIKEIISQFIVSQ